ncbi:glycosyltransferase family 4 protein [Gemmatimonadota bacterium]
MRIGLVLPAMVTGGAEQVVLELASNYQDSGHLVEVIAISKGGSLAARFKDRGLPTAEMNFRRSFRWSFGWWREVSQLRRALRVHFLNRRFDVVHTHLKGPDIDALVAGRQVGVPVLVHTIHNAYLEYAGRGVWERVRNLRRKRLWGLYDRLYAVDEGVLNWVVQTRMVEPGKVGVVRNGVDLSQFCTGAPLGKARQRFGWHKDDKVLLNIGSLTTQKNQTAILDALALLPSSLRGLRLAIAGSGPLDVQLSKRAAEMGIAPIVELLGVRADVPELLAAADVFVFPSLWEGLPIALLEAMASGTPIVASDIPVHRRILDGGRLGALSSPKPESLASALKGVFLDPEGSAKRAQEAGVQVRNRYDGRRMASEYLSEYQRLLSEKRDRASS